jgi:16S rRNA (guanine527-N7)-methyltransferase
MITVSSSELLRQYLDRDKLDLFLNEAEQANRKFNLFSRNFKREDLRVLAAESLIPVRQGWIHNNSSPILDIGSGWGIPAIPLLLFRPGLKITLVERSQKKADFLLLLLHRLGLIADTICCDLGRLQTPHKYSMITVRGVAADKKVISRLKNLLRPGGSLIYFGSKFPTDESVSFQSLEYSIDNLPVRNINKFSFL